ncbi:MAG TPA: hypothetical protein VFK15_14795 [Burkholderiales bacterium]|nr:hypothetical protein [Burkholderiales bacterium]
MRRPRLLHAAPLAIATVLAQSGCSVALSGESGSGRSATTVATSGSIGVSRARAGASFGAAAPSTAPGGHVSLSGGAAAVMVVGLVVADIVNQIGPRRAPAIDPVRPIAHTCSCYGYVPPAQLTSNATAE